MEQEIKIKGCYNTCCFFISQSDGMECNHPYWKDRSPYENMIITQINSRDGKIPEKCPLRIAPLTVTYKL